MRGGRRDGGNIRLPDQQLDCVEKTVVTVLVKVENNEVDAVVGV
jgi:hypothetical protein